MDFELMLSPAENLPEDPIVETRRRLNAAKKRARYWSGMVRFHRESFSVRRSRKTKNRGNDYQAAMEEVRFYTQKLSEFTGKKIKLYCPRPIAREIIIADLGLSKEPT